MQRELLTAVELAERLRLHPETLMTWARRGRIPAHRLSRKVIRFCLPDVLAALDAAATTGPNDTPDGSPGCES